MATIIPNMCAVCHMDYETNSDKFSRLNNCRHMFCNNCIPLLNKCAYCSAPITVTTITTIITTAPIIAPHGDRLVIADDELWIPYLYENAPLRAIGYTHTIRCKKQTDHTRYKILYFNMGVYTFDSDGYEYMDPIEGQVYIPHEINYINGFLYNPQGIVIPAGLSGIQLTDE